MKAIFSRLLAIFFFVLLVLLCAEGLIRLSYKIVNEPSVEARTRFFQSTYANIYRLWNSGPKEDPLLPPFEVFGNNGASDSARLKEISQKVRLMPNRNYRSYDFIRFDEKPENTPYVVHSNTFGFRGSDWSKEKPKGTFRIVVLGSYQTFGLGVNDEETYAFQLEKLLNQNTNSVTHYEVWNAGRPAGTAIVGLALLKNEFLADKPDFIVVDYGFIDAQVFGDDVFPAALHLPKGLMGYVIRNALMPSIALLEHSFLAGRMSRAFSLGQNEQNLARYKEVMLQIEKACREKNVPVIFVEQLGVPDLSQTLSPESILSVFQTFSRHPPSPELYSSSIANAWVRSLPPDALFHPSFSFFPYRLNPFQLNKFGHRVLAERIAEKITKKHVAH